MRTLTFNHQDGDFYLDQYECVGDYIELSDVAVIRTRRVQGQACFEFRTLLRFCCNISKPEYVEFYTFRRAEKDTFMALAITNGCYVVKSTRDVGKKYFVLDYKELVI